MFADAPQRRIRRHGVVEDPEERERFTGDAIGEIGLVEIEAQGDSGHEPMPQPRHRRHVVEHALAKSCRDVGEEIGTVHRRPHADLRVIAAELLAEVDAFLLIGTARRQLVADWKVASPGAAGERHANVHLRLDVLREELTAEADEARLQFLVYAMADDIEEAALAARLAKLGRRRPLTLGACEQRAYIDDRDLRKVSGRIH